MKLNIAVGAQWGDEGKGKINLHLAQGADICMRCGGGSNAECSVYTSYRHSLRFPHVKSQEKRLTK